MPPGGQPPPGYYPDPDDPSVNRWWDGQAWATPAADRESSLPPPTDTSSLPPPQPTPLNSLAVWSLILAVLWLGFLGSIAGVILGHVATAQIEASEDTQRGRGFAIAGMLVGYIGVGMLAVVAADWAFGS